MKKVPTLAPFVAAPRSSFHATEFAMAETTTVTYMPWLGGIDVNACSFVHQANTSNLIGTDGSKRTNPGHLGGGLT
ncbi:MAG: hypothetical protein DRJ50_15270 [Actinobacteria bacterium]|nr:MAG: hypothetical protein DRJ50_15270 [Actinomycetota bacterium]